MICHSEESAAADVEEFLLLHSAFRLAEIPHFACLPQAGSE